MPVKLEWDDKKRGKALAERGLISRMSPGSIGIKPSPLKTLVWDIRRPGL
jgi:hypothetical protein